MENQSNPPNRFISLCKMGTAIVLPLCWGKKVQEYEGLVPRKKGLEGGLASLAPSHFSISPEGIWLACVYAYCPAQPVTGEQWRPLSSPPLPAGQLQQLTH